MEYKYLHLLNKKNNPYANGTVQNTAKKKKQTAAKPVLTQAEYNARGELIVKEAIAKLTLAEKLAQLQSGSIYLIEQMSDAEGNLSTDSLKKY